MDNYVSYDLTRRPTETYSAAAAAGIHGEERTPQKSNRIMLNGMLWMNQSGTQWRQLPECYAPWQSVYARFAKRRDDGILEAVFSGLNQNTDTENLSIDPTCITEHKAVGRAKGGLNTKIHAIVDGLENPAAFLLSPGNDNDSTHAIGLMGKTDIAGSSLLGDKAYGTKEILAYIEEHGAAVVIPPKSNAKEPWPATCIKSAISLSVSSRRLNGFAGLLQAMINLISLFSLLYIWLLS